MISPRALSTADERRTTVLSAATGEFARHGFAGASTARIAAASGIAHSYLFKLFPSKKALFIEVSRLVYERIEGRFAAAAAASPEDPLTAMGEAYSGLLREREQLLVLLHGFAAADDPELGSVIRGCYLGLYRAVLGLAGSDPHRVQGFWSHGMLMTIAAALQLPDAAGDDAHVTQMLARPRS
jgi:AcrR family transcriptional regulator